VGILDGRDLVDCSRKGTTLLSAITRAYRDAFSGLPRAVWLEAAAMLVNRSGTMVLPFLGLYLTHERGFTAIAAGRVLSLYGIGAIAGSFLGGWLSDRIGPVRVQQASLLGAGVGFVVLGQLVNPVAIGVAVLALSTAADAFRPATFAAVAQRSAVAVRTRSLALIRLAANLGMSIGPAVGGFLAVHHYGLLFWADAITSWLAALVLAVSFRGAAGGVGHAPGITPGGRRSPWRDGVFVCFLLLMTVFATVFFQIMSTMPLYWREHLHLAEDHIGVLLALNTVIIVLVEMILVRAVENRDPLRLVAFGALLVCVGFALMPLAARPLLVAATIVVWTVGEMLSLPISNAFASLRSGSEGAGRYMGAYMLAFAAAFVLAPLVGTTVYQRWGGEALWLGCGGIGVILAVGFAWLSVVARRELASE
jgi:predicted MFS family arabinose efflux permease